jgi:hypothetical protein
MTTPGQGIAADIAEALKALLLTNNVPCPVLSQAQG